MKFVGTSFARDVVSETLSFFNHNKGINEISYYYDDIVHQEKFAKMLLISDFAICLMSLGEKTGNDGTLFKYDWYKENISIALCQRGNFFWKLCVGMGGNLPCLMILRYYTPLEVDMHIMMVRDRILMNLENLEWRKINFLWAFIAHSLHVWIRNFGFEIC